MTHRRSIARAPLVAVLALGAASCAPRARPLAGAPVPELRLPAAQLPAGSQRMLFRWKYEEADGFRASGEGVARITSPDSARLDFFLDGGMGGGWALLLGDRISAPGGDLVRRLPCGSLSGSGVPPFAERREGQLRGLPCRYRLAVP